MMSSSSTKQKKKALTQEDYKAKLHSNTKITSLNVATLPRPGTNIPTSIRFLSDSKISYLQSPDPTSLTRQLYMMDIKSGEKCEVVVGGDVVEEGSFTLEEQMRRERARLMATGVTSYQICSGGSKDKVLIPHGGGLWIWDVSDDDDDDGMNNSKPRLLIDKNAEGLTPDAPILDAKISADGGTVGFLSNDEVYVISTDSSSSSKPKQVTFGARGIEGRSNGAADYLAQEELERPDGFWLSPDGSMLVFEEVDESHIPPYRIVHQADPRGLSSGLLKEGMEEMDLVAMTKVTYEEHRFCFAGTVNPKVRVGIQKTDGGKDVMWLDLESIFGPDFYLAKVEWLEDNSAIVVQLLDRKQKRLALLLYDAHTGQRTNLHMERGMDQESSWINLNDAFRVLDHDNTKIRFLWGSEKDGYRHLYIMETSLSTHDFDSIQIRRVTPPGEYIVDNVLTLDEHKEVVYYTGTSPGKWLGKRLFRARLDGSTSSPQCLTPEKGQHHCVVHCKTGFFVDAVSTVDYPTRVSLRKLPENMAETPLQDVQLEIYDATKSDPRVSELNLQPPTFFTIPSSDDDDDKKVTLQAAIYLPDASKHGPGPYPLLVATYGGPHLQYVKNDWSFMTADLRSQYLREHGFAILKLDNRGSNRRGLGFETPIYGRMGSVEVDDQVCGVKYAVERKWADPDRVAVSGWSYGGYMALKCLMTRPDVFHAAVSGAPVTDWMLYDTAYTERYMGLPNENVAGYQQSSVLGNVDHIQGSLMLCHGLMDENVLFRQTAVLIDQLIDCQKAYDLVLFPKERHGPRRLQDRAFLEERILAFLQRSLSL